MMELLTYFLQVIAISSIILLYYYLFLRDKTFHHYNRFYLVFGVLFSFLIPLIKVSYFTIPLDFRWQELVFPLEHYALNTPDSLLSNYSTYVFYLVGAISTIFTLGLVRSIYQVYVIKNSYPREDYKGISFYSTSLEHAPFSFFKNLFWKDTIDLNTEIGKQILKHEMIHIEQRHSIDKIFIELIARLFWFNPLFHLYKKELNIIHEYLADEKAVANRDLKSFARMILASQITAKTNAAVHPFFNSSIKKRVKMLQKSKTKLSYTRKLAVLPILFSLVFFTMVYAQNKEIKLANSTVAKAFTVTDSTQNKAVNTTSKFTVESEYKEYSAEDKVELKEMFMKLLKDYGNKDLYFINNKKVSKSVLKKFLNKNYGDKHLTYSFTHSSPEDRAIIKVNCRNQNSYSSNNSLSTIEQPKPIILVDTKNTNDITVTGLHNNYTANSFEIKKANNNIHLNLNSGIINPQHEFEKIKKPQIYFFENGKPSHPKKTSTSINKEKLSISVQASIKFGGKKYLIVDKNLTSENSNSINSTKNSSQNPKLIIGSNDPLTEISIEPSTSTNNLYQVSLDGKLKPKDQIKKTNPIDIKHIKIDKENNQIELFTK